MTMSFFNFLSADKSFLLVVLCFFVWFYNYLVSIYIKYANKKQNFVQKSTYILM